MHWPPRRILVGCDFSEAAADSFRAAAALARRVGARIDLLHVLAHPKGSRTGFEPLDALFYRDPSGELARAEAEKRLAALAREVAPGRTEIHLAEGDPVTELLAKRDLLGADLVALGGAGLRGVRRVILGSVAGKLLGHPGCPLLLVTAPPPGGEFKAILVAQESPRTASPWLEVALHLAHDERSEATLLHVLPPAGYASDAHRVELEPESAPAHLAGLRARLEPTVPAKIVVRRGDPAHEIPAVARELGVHLVVLGAERSGARGSPGRITNDVARAGLPALLVVWPEPESDEEFGAP
ncbi:MAG TPA: universal stress protein [Myxococcota bacterium]|nr:universal stress protein [Myxococcota bacterium]